MSKECLEQQRVLIVEGRKAGHVELEDAPDMVLEVVSDSSVEKDTVVLREAYARAGISEYWLVDVRGKALSFELLRLKGGKYGPARKRKGWVRSDVFALWFQLECAAGLGGFKDYSLEVADEVRTWPYNDSIPEPGTADVHRIVPPAPHHSPDAGPHAPACRTA